MLQQETDTELLLFMTSEETKSGFVATGGEDGVNGKVFMTLIISFTVPVNLQMRLLAQFGSNQFKLR